jgi:hypothetical protein
MIYTLYISFYYFKANEQTKDDLIDKLEEKNLELEEKIAEMEVII